MSKQLADIQNGPANIPLDIDQVGIKGLTLPLEILDKFRGSQYTVAKIDLNVDLPSQFKGTHMSRFLEALSLWERKLSYTTVRHLLVSLQKKLNAKNAHVRFSFPYFIEQCAPVSKQTFAMDFESKIEGHLIEDQLIFILQVKIPVMTVCPCSLALSKKGAHTQRAVITITAWIKKFLWLEDLIAIGLKAGSSPVYPLIKRADEKEIIDQAFSNPMFVEDVVRNVAKELNHLEHVLWYKVEVESFESIHNHSAYASIEGELPESDQARLKLLTKTGQCA
ncbi:MAG: GTP cyclohydrolase FolE2 [Desulfonauticus sp.]|nr:GTP cyclohydrolase FolE2 [Desulfonauticus sp.]